MARLYYLRWSRIRPLTEEIGAVQTVRKKKIEGKLAPIFHDHLSFSMNRLKTFFFLEGQKGPVMLPWWPCLFWRRKG